MFLFFKQKTAYEMRISDWSSDVCSSDLAAIQRSLARVSEDRTSIVIAHRLSTVRHALRIHVLEAREVVAHGTHEELVEQGGLYAALWRVQNGEAAVAAADRARCYPGRNPGGRSQTHLLTASLRALATFTLGTVDEPKRQRLDCRHLLT